MAISRLDGGVRVTSWPAMSIWPLVRSSSPAIILSMVDLPQPDGPTKTTNSPFSTSRLMPLMTSRLPKDLRTSRSESCVMFYPLTAPMVMPLMK